MKPFPSCVSLFSQPGEVQIALQFLLASWTSSNAFCKTTTLRGLSQGANTGRPRAQHFQPSRRRTTTEEVEVGCQKVFWGTGVSATPFSASQRSVRGGLDHRLDSRLASRVDTTMSNKPLLSYSLLSPPALWRTDKSVLYSSRLELCGTMKRQAMHCAGRKKASWNWNNVLAHNALLSTTIYRDHPSLTLLLEVRPLTHLLNTET